MVDAASAATLVGDPRLLRAWIELIRVEASAHDLAGDAANATRLTTRADALEREAIRMEAAEESGR